MRRFLVPGVATALAIALIAVLAYGVGAQGENTSIDSQIAHGHYPVAPSARNSLPLLSASGRASLASYRGQVVVMNIFASWCDSCVGEMPLLEGIQQRLGGHGTTVLGVTFEDAASSARLFMAAHHVTYPVLQDADGSFVSAFGTDQVPETFVISATGRVVGVLRGPVSSAWLTAELARARAVTQPA